MSIYKLITILSCVGILMVTQRTKAQQITISLDSAKQLALTNNRDIRQAQQHLEAAEAAEASAKAANKPTVDASVVGLYLGEPMQTILPETSLNGSLAISEVVYAGGKIRNGKKMATSSVLLQTSQKELTESEILLQTETAYWQLVSTYEQVALAQKYLLLLDTLHQDLLNTYNAGVINKNDVLRVKVRLNDAQISLQTALDGLEIAKRSFAQLTGINTLDFVLEDNIPEAETSQQLLTDPDAVVNRRAEINILEQSVKMQELQVDLLEGDRRPSLAVTLNGIYAAGDNIDFSDGSNNFTSAVGLVSLSIPILDWGGRKQLVKEQKANAQAQQLELENTKELISIEIRNAYLELKRASIRVKLSQESLEQAKENLRLLNDQFDAGTITGKDVLEGQVLWQEAYAQVIDAKTSLKINEASYLKAIAEY
ncbi:TolC family protein [Fulvivirga maritima]|uniref:TolC family protein n=1 Tax=Fulvivirga maritima TaxID=2904247 RepID=UPI001F1FD114|nr:TolC family protein [Fulvivirga maritima]UII27525.1 TolC family protein [Fulvivirga maritima]